MTIIQSAWADTNTCTIVGNIKGVDSWKPYKYVSIQLNENGYIENCTVDSAGHFERTGLSSGKYSITVIHNQEKYRVTTPLDIGNVTPNVVWIDLEPIN